MMPVRQLSVSAAIALICAAAIAAVFGLKAYRAAQEINGLGAQLNRVQESTALALQARERRKAQGRTFAAQGRVYPRLPAEQVRTQLDQMMAGLSGTPAHPDGGMGTATASATDSGLLVLSYRTRLDLPAAQLTSFLAGLEQARPGLLLTHLRIEPLAPPASGLVAVNLEGLALVEP